MRAADGRPIYLNLFKIKLPMPGIISIMHRVFGVLLSFSIPLLTGLFALSLQSEKGFETAIHWLKLPWLIPVYFVMLWGFVHHLLAGIRYLLIDIEIGVDRDISYKSSWLVLVAGLVVSLIIAGGLWL